jgi:hypothetical protein
MKSLRRYNTLKKGVDRYAMPGIALHRHLFPALWIVLLVLLSSGFVITAHAGLRGPGKYCGVVVFDRWDTCFLLSGPYIT